MLSKKKVRNKEDEETRKKKMCRKLQMLSAMEMMQDEKSATEKS